MTHSIATVKRTLHKTDPNPPYVTLTNSLVKTLSHTGLGASWSHNVSLSQETSRWNLQELIPSYPHPLQISGVFFRYASYLEAFFDPQQSILVVWKKPCPLQKPTERIFL